MEYPKYLYKPKNGYLEHWYHLQNRNVKMLSLWYQDVDSSTHPTHLLTIRLINGRASAILWYFTMCCPLSQNFKILTLDDYIFDYYFINFLIFGSPKRAKWNNWKRQFYIYRYNYFKNLYYNRFNRSSKKKIWRGYWIYEYSTVFIFGWIAYRSTGNGYKQRRNAWCSNFQRIALQFNEVISFDYSFIFFVNV